MTLCLGDCFRQRQEPGVPGLPVMSVTLNHSLVLRESIDRRLESALRPDQHLLVKKGDIAYNMMRMWQGACGLATADGIVSPAYVVLTPKAGIDSRFAYHWFKSDRMIYLFWAYSHGLTEDRLRLYFDEFAEIPVSPPDLVQQRRIAALLDGWDQAIAHTEKLITSKRKRREQLIKSLLLRHISTQSLGSIANVIMGQSPSSTAYNDVGNGLPLVQGAGDFDEWGVHPSVWTTHSPKKASKGAIIMSVRAPVGLVTRSDLEVCLGRGVCALISDTQEDAEFILASLRVNGGRWNRLSQGTSFDAIGTEQFEEFHLAWPEKHVRQTVGCLHRSMLEEERDLTLILARMCTQKRGVMQKVFGSECRLDERFDPPVLASSPMLAKGTV